MIYGPYSTGWRDGQNERRNARRRAAWAWLGVLATVGAAVVVYGWAV